MEEVTKLSADAIQRYFNTLSKFGYKSYADVDKMMVLFFLEEVLAHDFMDFITEDDYRHIVNALYCLFGSTCLIEFPEFANYDSLVHKTKVYLTPRITEDSVLRISEKDMMRVEA